MATRICHSTDRAAWLAARGELLTASDISAVFGLSKYKSLFALWAEKRGSFTPDEPGEAAWWGLAAEPMIRQWYTEHTGRPCEPDGWLYRSDEFPFLGATPDGWTEIDGERVPVELKTAAAHLADDWSDGVPRYYAPQVQAQMLVLGARRAHVVVCIGGNRGAWVEVERDDDMCAGIAAFAGEFWRMVQANELPAIDGSASTSAALAAIYPENDAAGFVELGQEGVSITDRIDELDAAIGPLDEERKQLRTQLVAMLGTAGRGILPGGLGSWTYRRGKGGGLRRSKK